MMLEKSCMQTAYTARTDKSPIRVKINTGSGTGWRALLTYGDSNMGKFANDAYSAELTPETWYSVKYVVYPSGNNASDIELFFGEKDSDPQYIENYTMSNWTKITDFQIFGLKDDLYLDNFSVATYSADIYTQINKCATAEDVKSVLEFYMSNKLMEKKSYDASLYADKLAVCAEIAGAVPYASADAFNTAFDEFIAAKSDGATIYYNWDFENGSLVDYVNGTEFMAGLEASKSCVSVAADPNEKITNNTAKIDLSTADEKLVSTSAVKNDLENVRYVVYDAHVYHDVYNANEEQQNLEFQVRYANGTRKALMLFQVGRQNRWNTYKTVVDTESQKEYGYIYLNNEWKISNSGLDATDMTTFDPNELRIRDKDNKGTVYFDNVTIKGYKNLYEEVNAATENNVSRVLEAFEDMNIIKLTGYAELTDEEKAEFAKQVKSKTYASDDEVRSFVGILLSEDELVVVSPQINDNKLNSVSVVINAQIASDIDASSTKLIMASYDVNGELVSVGFVQPESLEKFAEINVSDLGLNVEGATEIKYMLWECKTGEEVAITPLVRATASAL